MSWTLADQWAEVAASHRRKAEWSEPDEAAHWRLEAERFDELAEIARTDPERARELYRPARAYEPSEEENRDRR